MTYTVRQANGQACPSWLSFNASTLTFSGTVPAGMESLSLTVTVTDTSGLSCSETFAVIVPAAAPTLAHQTAAQIWTDWAQFPPLATWKTYQEGDDDSGFWPGEATGAGSAQAFLDLVEKEESRGFARIYQGDAA